MQNLAVEPGEVTFSLSEDNFDKALLNEPTSAQCIERLPIQKATSNQTSG
jgi:hypothetical protein